MVENGSSDTPHVDEGTMHAWLDGALPADVSRTIEAHVATCEKCAAAAAEARGLIAASTRILSALDDVPGDVVPAAARSVPASLDATSAASRHVRSTRTVRAYASIAAVAAIAVGLTLVARERSTPAAHRVAQQIIAVPETAVDTDTRPGTRAGASTGATPQRAERSVATASGAQTHADHGEAEKQRASSPSAGKSRAASEPVLQGVAAGVAASPSPDSLTITGRVTAAATGLPLAGARVSVVGTAATAATDSTGTFTVPAMPAGTHTLLAQKIGFGASHALVNLSTDHAAKVTFALPSEAMMLSEVVTSGVTRRIDGLPESPPEITGAHVVSSNVYAAGGSRVRRTTFQLDSGATVTLEERRPPRAAPAVAEDRFDTSARADTHARTAPLTLRAPSGPATQSLMWVSPDSTVLILSGPLSRKELEELRKRVVP